MSRTNVEVVTALNVLSDVALTVREFSQLMAQEVVTEEDVDRALDRTDAAIERARRSD